MLGSAASSQSSASPWCLIAAPGGCLRQRQRWAVASRLKGNGLQSEVMQATEPFATPWACQKIISLL